MEVQYLNCPAGTKLASPFLTVRFPATPFLMFQGPQIRQPPWARHFLTITGLIVAAELPAQGFSPVPIGQQAPTWRIQDFLPASGIGDESLFHLSEGPEGSLWISGSRGLHQYDGYRWTHFQQQDGLPADYVRCTLWTAKGDLWVGTRAGAMLFPGGRLAEGGHRYLPDCTIRRIYQDPDGSIWFCCDEWPVKTPRAGLLRFQNGEWTHFAQDSGLPTHYVSSYFLSSDGERFALTAEGLAQWDGKRFFDPLEEAGLDKIRQYFWSMAEDLNGVLYAVTARKLYRRGARGWEPGIAIPEEVRNPRLVVAEDGAILTCGTGKTAAFWQIQDQRFAAVTDSFAGSDYFPEHLLESSDGSLWAVSSGYLLRWQRRNAEWTRMGFHGDPLGPGREGAFWFSSGRLEGDGRWRPWASKDLRVLYRGKDQPVWARDMQRFYRWSDQTRQWKFLSPLPPGMFPNYRLQTAGQDQVWLSGSDDQHGLMLAAWTSAGWKTGPALPFQSGQQRLPLAGDPEGGWWWWIRQSNRLILSRGNLEGWQDVPPPPAWGANHPPTMFIEPDGTRWLFGFYGLFSQSKDASPWQRIEGLPGQHVFDLRICNGDLWVASTGITGGVGGISRRLPDGVWQHLELPLRRALGQDEFGHPVYESRDCQLLWLDDLDTFSGLRCLQLPEVATMNALHFQPGNGLWVSTNQGVFLYRRPTAPIETLLSAFPASVLENHPIRLSAQISPYFHPPLKFQHSRYQYRIPPGDWITLEPRVDGVLELPGKKPGTYDLEIRAMDPSGRVDPTPSRQTLTVSSLPFYRQPWFANLALAIAGIGALAAIGMLKSRLAWKRKTTKLASTVTSKDQEIQQQNFLYRQLFQQAADAILLVHPDGRFQDFNSAALRLLDCKEDQLKQQRLQDFLADSAVMQKLHEGSTAGLVNIEEETEILRPDGSRKQVQVFITGGWGRRLPHPGFQIILTDLTRRRQLEEQLQRSQKMEALTRLAGGVAHDFNNLLTVMAGCTELLAEQLDGRDGASGNEELATIREATDRARFLTSQLQTFGRGSVVAPDRLEINQHIRQRKAYFENLLGPTCNLKLELDPGLWQVQIDENQLLQVYENLIVNAKEAMPRGGKLEIRSCNSLLTSEDEDLISNLSPGAYVQLIFQDEGVGMTEEIRKRIFDPFFSTKESRQGTGLGLATVYGIVHKFGGDILVESQPEGGTRFRMFLPAIQRSNQVPEPKLSPPAPAQTAASEPSKRILLVEDEPRILRFLQALLEEWEYQVSPAGDGETALQLASQMQPPPDLLLSDILLPGMDGRELSKTLRNQFPQLEVILMSGFDTTPVEEGNQAPPLLLRKPFTSQELKEILQRAESKSSNRP
ncbi:MAG: response regulator [Planctomycetota bacterium]|nr:MAG: response regulator [Planctomycetota bacterium]